MDDRSNPCASSFLCIPEELLFTVLSFVPPLHRLLVLSLVSREWLVSCRESVEHLPQFRFRSSAGLIKALQILPRVTSLDISQASVPGTYVPAQLRHLSLFEGTGFNAIVLSSASALTSLSLARPEDALLHALHYSKHLISLELQIWINPVILTEISNLSFPALVSLSVRLPSNNTQHSKFDAWLATLLPQLTSLTCLSSRGNFDCCNTVVHPNLRVLTISGEPLLPTVLHCFHLTYLSLPASALKACPITMPAHLKLHVTNICGSFSDYDPTEMSKLMNVASQVTGLSFIRLDDADFLLPEFSSLTTLEIEREYSLPTLIQYPLLRTLRIKMSQYWQARFATLERIIAECPSLSLLSLGLVDFSVTLLPSLSHLLQTALASNLVTVVIQLHGQTNKSTLAVEGVRALARAHTWLTVRVEAPNG